MRRLLALSLCALLMPCALPLAAMAEGTDRTPVLAIASERLAESDDLLCIPCAPFDEEDPSSTGLLSPIRLVEGQQFGDYAPGMLLIIRPRKTDEEASPPAVKAVTVTPVLSLAGQVMAVSEINSLRGTADVRVAWPDGEYYTVVTLPEDQPPESLLGRAILFTPYAVDGASPYLRLTAQNVRTLSHIEGRLTDSEDGMLTLNTPARTDDTEDTSLTLPATFFTNTDTLYPHGAPEVEGRIAILYDPVSMHAYAVIDRGDWEAEEMQ